jgi:hypothetical protein
MMVRKSYLLREAKYHCAGSRTLLRFLRRPFPSAGEYPTAFAGVAETRLYETAIRLRALWGFECYK